MNENIPRHDDLDHTVIEFGEEPSRQSLEAVFSGTDFDRKAPTIYIWEGVTQYFPI